MKLATAGRAFVQYHFLRFGEPERHIEADTSPSPQIVSAEDDLLCLTVGTHTGELDIEIYLADTDADTFPGEPDVTGHATIRVSEPVLVFSTFSGMRDEDPEVELPPGTTSVDVDVASYGYQQAAARPTTEENDERERLVIIVRCH